MLPGSETLRRSRWIMACLLLVLSGVAIWQYSRAVPAPPTVDWPGVPRSDLVTAALYLDVQEGGPRLALGHLADLARRDKAIRELGHGYAHDVGRYALRWHKGDPGVFAECTPQFYAGCYHGLIESYINQTAQLNQSDVSQLCDRIVGTIIPEVARRECAHGLGHGLWFRLKGNYRQALSYCDHLAGSISQEECRDGVFMQRAGADPGHVHSHRSSAVPVSLECTKEPPRYSRACWHYQGRLFVEGQDYRKAFKVCDAAGDYVEVCYWGLGKWIAGRVTIAGGTNDQIVALCGQGQNERLGTCVAGAAETLVDENWTIEPGERLCRFSPKASQAECRAKLRERSAILGAGPQALSKSPHPIGFHTKP